LLSIHLVCTSNPGRLAHGPADVSDKFGKQTICPMLARPLVQWRDKEQSAQ
jgi:hypothetical protein